MRTRGFKYYMGCDIARMGGDETTFEIIEKIDDNNLMQTENIVAVKQFLTQTTEQILGLNIIYNFAAIGIDDAGTGAGVFDNLMKEDATKRKTYPLNNARKPLDRDEKAKRRLLKEDMYMNLAYLMEKGKLKLLDDDELILSLKSVQYEYVTKQGQATKFRIFGNYTHIAEGLIRAAWCITQDKRLNLWVEGR